MVSQNRTKRMGNWLALGIIVATIVVVGLILLGATQERVRNFFIFWNGSSSGGGSTPLGPGGQHLLGPGGEQRYY